MANNELELLILRFNFEKESIQDEVKRRINLQSVFVSDFKPESIQALGLDEYVLGKQSKNSFCYRIETGLLSLGNMKGSTSTKFSVYYGVQGKDKEVKYRFTKKFGNDLEEAFSSIKLNIFNLINAGAVDNRDLIISNKIAPLFKFKILGSYFPDKYLNLYSEDHLDHFISELGLNNTSTEVYDKIKLLLRCKDSNPVTKAWNNYEFNIFLYRTFGRPKAKSAGTLEDSKYLFLPPIEKVNPSEVELEFDEELYKIKGIKKNSRNKKVDYFEKYNFNNRLGKRGENIAFNFEKTLLDKAGIKNYLIRLVSDYDDSLGYDIEVDVSGHKKYIEVKSTTRKPGLTSFFISENELRTSKSLDNYFIYIVFEAHTVNPKIWRVESLFTNYSDQVLLMPINYKVLLNTRLIDGTP